MVKLFLEQNQIENNLLIYAVPVNCEGVPDFFVFVSNGVTKKSLEVKKLRI